VEEQWPVGNAGPDVIAADADKAWMHDPRAVQILATEHWSLLASRSVSWTESFSRAGMFLTSVSGAVVALALVGQSTAYGRVFVTFALILLPVVLFLGLTTVVRLIQVNDLDLLYLQAMNRLRHAYIEAVPGLAVFFSTATHDDLRASFFSTFVTNRSANPMVQGLMTTPGMVSVVCSVLAGAIAGIAVSQFGASAALAIGVGALGFAICLIALVIYRKRSFESFSRGVEVRFPSAHG
jgi:hypothetical protein